MTKRQAKVAHKEAWIKALKEGRVVKYAELGISKEFATAEIAETEASKTGGIVDIPTQEYWANYAGGVYR